MIKNICFHEIYSAEALSTKSYITPEGVASEDVVKRLIEYHLDAGYDFKKVNEVVEDDLYNNKKIALLSFDDGFLSSYKFAQSHLVSNQIKATFNIITGYPNDEIIHWARVLERVIESRSWLEIQGVGRFDLRTESERAHAFKMISSAFVNEKREIVHIKKEFEESGFLKDSERYHMNWEEIELLARNPLFEIGNHSRYHDFLSGLSEDELSVEIKMSHEEFEKHGIHPSCFCLPYGDLNTSVIEVVEAFGYRKVLLLNKKSKYQSPNIMQIERDIFYDSTICVRSL